jgi:hypothetical protein
MIPQLYKLIKFCGNRPVLHPMDLAKITCAAKVDMFEVRLADISIAYRSHI